MINNIIRFLNDEADQICEKINNNKLKVMFKQCFLNTIETTTKIMEDGTSYVFTGDIPAMWLRDSSCQVIHYLPFCSQNEYLKKLISGLIRRQMNYIQVDPYANAFNEEPNGRGHKSDLTDHFDFVWERKYEVDSLCYPIWLAYKYWKNTGDTSIFDKTFEKSIQIIYDLWKTEQIHENSHYSFIRNSADEGNILANLGKGLPVNKTNMTWSGFRPSDDACKYNYLIPSNMFAVVCLKYLAEIYQNVLHNNQFSGLLLKFSTEIDEGIQKFGIVHHAEFGKIFAYETDGNANYHFMDDANVPSLLSIPFIEYCDLSNEIYKNTRKFILSKSNPYYFEGKYAKGIGSPHTSRNYIWHIGLIMQALTSNEPDEIKILFEYLLDTDAGTGFMHEGFNCDNPNEYTRKWFAWANSLFAYLIVMKLPHINDLLK